MVQKNIAGYGVLLTEMEKDSSTGFKGSCHRAKTLKRHQRMRNRKRDDGLLEAVYIPPEQHIQSKAETFIVEGYNSLFRHFLGRKSKCYSKSLLMLEYSIKLLMLKWNKELYILN